MAHGYSPILLKENQIQFRLRWAVAQWLRKTVKTVAQWLESAIAQWLAHWPLILEVFGTVLACVEDVDFEASEAKVSFHEFRGLMNLTSIFTAAMCKAK